MNLKKIQVILENFSNERDWNQFHSPKNLSMALNVEASELLEIFQWLTEEESYNLSESKRVQTKNEIADIAIYLIKICTKFNIDLEEAILEKIELNKKKYPVDQFKGSSKKYDEL